MILYLKSPRRRCDFLDQTIGLNVFVTNKDYKADLNVYTVSKPYEVKNNYGLWFFTNKKYDSDKKIFFCDYEYQADLKIFFFKNLLARRIGIIPPTEWAKKIIFLNFFFFINKKKNTFEHSLNCPKKHHCLNCFSSDSPAVKR